jgi:enterochelin esterase family protein
VLISDTIVLRHSDPDHTLAGVRLVQEIGLPADQLEFQYNDDDRAWSLRLPPVAVRRLEYRLELRRDREAEVICDPANPQRAPGGFGDKSVIELAGYDRPEWLDLPGAAGEWRDLSVSSRALKANVPVRIWTPPGARGVMLAHDGGEFDRLIGLGQYSSAMVASGAMPPHHLVLLSPVERNDWYSANPAYARALAQDVLPAVRAELGTGAAVVALGASLGGLALLHAQRRHSDLFGGMFLQSGSFFQQRFDAQESRFPHYRRIVRFVAGMRRNRPTGAPVPTVITCGIAEENLANNRDMAHTLRRQGYPLRLIEVPDAHNLVAFRDAWHPQLADLAREVWTIDQTLAQDV